MRRLLHIMLLLTVPAMMMADRLSREEATAVAAPLLGTDTLVVARWTDNYCIVQRQDNTAFAVIALTRQARRRVLAYSTESGWNAADMPPLVTSWLEHLEQTKTVATTRDNGIDSMPDVERQTVAPLLTCHWHQHSPYNDMAPIITDGQVKTVAGCVAIAAAQITYYWRKDNPQTTMRDTPTYIYGGAPVTEVVKKGSPNNWDLIQDEYAGGEPAEARAAAAQLCYVLGTTSYLNFASSTGGSIKDASNAMYSQYRLMSDYKVKSQLTQWQWEKLLYGQLAKGYPVLCAGQNAGGHAFVLDGYDSTTGLYHFNLGWGGSGDGYYPVDDSEDAMGGYYMSQAVVFDIHPMTRNVEAKLECRLSANGENRVEVVATMVNRGTLPVRELMLFAIPADGSVSETDQPVWRGGLLPNDGAVYNKVMVPDKDLSTQRLTVCLTDENRNVLGKTVVDVKNAISTLHTEADNAEGTAYGISGQRAANLHRKGLYIMDKGIVKTKVLIP